MNIDNMQEMLLHAPSSCHVIPLFALPDLSVATQADHQSSSLLN